MVYLFFTYFKCMNVCKSSRNSPSGGLAANTTSPPVSITANKTSNSHSIFVRCTTHSPFFAPFPNKPNYRWVRTRNPYANSLLDTQRGVRFSASILAKICYNFVIYCVLCRFEEGWTLLGGYGPGMGSAGESAQRDCVYMYFLCWCRTDAPLHSLIHATLMHQTRYKLHAPDGNTKRTYIK